MRSKLLTLAVMAAGLAFGAETKTWFVATNGVDAVGRGTAEAPFKTLQFAHDQASAGDTVKVAPGEYGAGEEHTSSEVAHPTRLIVTKTLNFQATGGASVTHIVGKLSDGSWGTGAVRGVYVSKDGVNSEFHGFTIRDCGSDSSGNGGGVCVFGSPGSDGRTKTDPRFAVYFIDCVFRNCRGYWGGALYCGAAIRCLFDACRSYTFGQAACGSAIWCCVVQHCDIDSGTRGTFGNRCLVVNSTVFGCSDIGMAGSCAVYNTVFCRQARTGIYTSAIGVYPASVCYASYDQTADDNSLVSPATGDFRLVAGTPAIGGGLTSYVTNCIVLPPGLELKDFYGNPFDLDRETCNAGAVQDQAAVAGGRIEFPAATSVNGWFNKRASYAWPTSWPMTVAVRPTEDRFFRYMLSGDTTDCQYRFLQEDGTLHICFPWDGTKKTVMNVQTYEHELWCSPTSDKTVADGTADHPFRTLQAAVDASTNLTGNVVVRALPGEYAEDTTLYLGQDRRLVIPDRALLIKSTAGAAQTVIRGLGDPDVTDDMGYEGCGPKAVACVAFSGTSAARGVQGFTLADGHSRCVDYRSTPDSDQGGAVAGGVDRTGVAAGP